MLSASIIEKAVKGPSDGHCGFFKYFIHLLVILLLFLICYNFWLIQWHNFKKIIIRPIRQIFVSYCNHLPVNGFYRACTDTFVLHNLQLAVLNIHVCIVYLCRGMDTVMFRFKVIFSAPDRTVDTCITVDIQSAWLNSWYWILGI